MFNPVERPFFKHSEELSAFRKSTPSEFLNLQRPFSPKRQALFCRQRRSSFLQDGTRAQLRIERAFWGKRGFCSRRDPHFGKVRGLEKSAPHSGALEAQSGDFRGHFGDLGRPKCRVRILQSARGPAFWRNGAHIEEFRSILEKRKPAASEGCGAACAAVGYTSWGIHGS